MQTLDKQELELNYQKEDSYWWFVGRRRLVISMIEKYAGKQENCKLLDAGCGTGVVMVDIGRFGEPTGVDVSKEALDFCRKRGLHNLVEAKVESLPFSDETFDVVTILGVLYSKWVLDEVKVCQELYRVMKKGGLLVIDEGAFKILTSRHNQRVGTIRRYRKNQIKAIMETAGFKVIKLSYWNMFLFPLFLFAKLLDNLSSSSTTGLANMEMPLPGFVNKILQRVLLLEIKILKFLNLPFGASLIAVGVKE